MQAWAAPRAALARQPAPKSAACQAGAGARGPMVVAAAEPAPAARATVRRHPPEPRVPGGGTLRTRGAPPPVAGLPETTGFNPRRARTLPPAATSGGPSDTR